MRIPVWIICLFAGCIVLSSCTRNKEKKQAAAILHADTLKLILYELYLADEINAFRFQKDSSLNRQAETIAYYKSVFEHHGTEYDQFMKSLNHYSADPKTFAVITDSLNRYARSMTGPGLFKFINRRINGNHIKDSARSSRR